jgi:hypothetical protein
MQTDLALRMVPAITEWCVGRRLSPGHRSLGKTACLRVGPALAAVPRANRKRDGNWRAGKRQPYRWGNCKCRRLSPGHERIGKTACLRVGPALAAVPRANRKRDGNWHAGKQQPYRWGNCKCRRLSPGHERIGKTACLRVGPALAVVPRANRKRDGNWHAGKRQPYRWGNCKCRRLSPGHERIGKTACLRVGPALAAAPRANRENAMPACRSSARRRATSESETGWELACRQAAALQVGEL